VTLGLAVQGDFEITVTFEVVQEPALGVTQQARFTLNAIPEGEGDNRHAVAPDRYQGGRRFFAWMRRQDEKNGEQPHTKELRTPARNGRLRVVRTGPDLAYYAAEGAKRNVQADRPAPVRAEGPEGHQPHGGDRGTEGVDRRARHRPARPRQLPAGCDDAKRAAPGPPSVGKRGWLTAGVVMGLVVLLSVAGWLYRRRAQR